MQVIIAQSKKKNWTNSTTRDALGIHANDQVRITKGNIGVSRTVSKAPAAASRIMRAIHAATGHRILAVTRDTIAALNAKVGDIVEVISVEEFERTAVQPARQVQSSAPASTSQKPGSSKPGSSKPQTLREKLAGAKPGTRLEVSESAAKSGAYKVAAQAGVRIKKVGPCLIEVI